MVGGTGFTHITGVFKRSPDCFRLRTLADAFHGDHADAGTRFDGGGARADELARGDRLRDVGFGALCQRDVATLRLYPVNSSSFSGGLSDAFTLGLGGVVQTSSEIEPKPGSKSRL